MATNHSIETARAIRAAIDSQGRNIQEVATEAGITPRTFREHLRIGALTTDELFAAARVLNMSAGDFLPIEHRTASAQRHAA